MQNVGLAEISRIFHGRGEKKKEQMKEKV